MEARSDDSQELRIDVIASEVGAQTTITVTYQDTLQSLKERVVKELNLISYPTDYFLYITGRNEALDDWATFEEYRGVITSSTQLTLALRLKKRIERRNSRLSGFREDSMEEKIFKIEQTVKHLKQVLEASSGAPHDSLMRELDYYETLLKQLQLELTKERLEDSIVEKEAEKKSSLREKKREDEADAPKVEVSSEALTFTEDVERLDEQISKLKEAVEESNNAVILAYQTELHDDYAERQETIKARLEHLVDKELEGASSEAERLVDHFEASRMVTPTKEQLKESEELYAKISQNPEDDKFIVHVMSSLLQELGVKLVLSKTVEVAQTLCLHLLNSGDMFQPIWQASIEESSTLTFAMLANSKSQKESFIEEFRAGLCKELGLKRDFVQVLNIEKGSIKVIYQIIDTDNNHMVQVEEGKMATAINQLYPSHKVHLKQHPVFEFCTLSPDQFDVRGNYDFRNSADVQMRGGFKYFQPKGWKRYGLSVLNKYMINGKPNNDWLAMDGRAGEWAVGFHGTKQWQAVRGITGDRTLKTDGNGQVYNNSIDTRTGRPCGEGAYFSNHIESAEVYSGLIAVGGVNYKVAFQCRLEPSSIRIPQKRGDHNAGNNPDWDNDYWIVNDAQNIRPYGILLKKKV